MKRRALLVLLVMLSCLLAGGTAQARPPLSGEAPPGVAVGFLYRLAVTSPPAAGQDGGWQILGAAAGTFYRLAPAAVPSGTGTPCCCSYLPCVTR